jgi:hypothetical protein
MPSIIYIKRLLSNNITMVLAIPICTSSLASSSPRRQMSQYHPGQALRCYLHLYLLVSSSKRALIAFWTSRVLAFWSTVALSFRYHFADPRKTLDTHTHASLRVSAITNKNFSSDSTCRWYCEPQCVSSTQSWESKWHSGLKLFDLPTV